MDGVLAILDFDSNKLILFDCGGLEDGTDLDQFVWDNWGQNACQWMYLKTGFYNIDVIRPKVKKSKVHGRPEIVG